MTLGRRREGVSQQHAGSRRLRRYYYYYCCRRLVVISVARGKVRRNVSLRVAMWCGAEQPQTALHAPHRRRTPFATDPFATAVFGVTTRRVGREHQRAQLYSGKIDGAITGRRPFSYTCTHTYTRSPPPPPPPLSSSSTTTTPPACPSR